MQEARVLPLRAKKYAIRLAGSFMVGMPGSRFLRASAYSLEQLQVRVDHAVIRGNSASVRRWMAPRRRAGVPVLRPPRVVEQSAAGRQQPDVGLLQGIVEARGEVLGLLDRRDAPIRFDEAERTNQAAERMHSRGSEAAAAARAAADSYALRSRHRAEQ